MKLNQMEILPKKSPNFLKSLVLANMGKVKKGVKVVQLKI